MFRLFLISLTLGFAADRALAGPIQWSYSTEFEFEQNYGGNAQLTWLYPTGTIDTITGQPVNQFLFNTEFANPKPAGPGVVEYRFNSNFTLTDTVSGESATVPFSGLFRYTWDNVPTAYDPNGNPIAWDLYTTTTEGSFTTANGSALVFLGDNRYRIEPLQSFSGSSLGGSVQVTGWSVAETPEPGTIVLAGLGLAGVAAVRRRRVVPLVTS